MHKFFFEIDSLFKVTQMHAGCLTCARYMNLGWWYHVNQVQITKVQDTRTVSELFGYLTISHSHELERHTTPGLVHTCKTFGAWEMVLQWAFLYFLDLFHWWASWGKTVLKEHGTNISVRLWNNMFAYELEGSLHLLKSTENPGQYSVPYIYLCTCQYCSYKVLFCEICDRWLRFTDLHLGGCGCV